MAVVRIPEKNQTIKTKDSIAEFLQECGILYEQWNPREVDKEASPEMVLTAYGEEIRSLNQRGGYVAADVVSLSPATNGLEAMLAKFNREHWHSEDEVRFVIDGHGLFHIRLKQKPVVGIQVEPGDLLCVPQGTLHWFDLCADRQIRAIRLFQDPGGWTPYYSESGVDKQFEPVCLGFNDFPSQLVRT